MTSECVTIQHLTFGYEKNNIKASGQNHKDLVFKDFSMSIPIGDRIALMAPSGSGKTTLLHLIAGLLKPQTGKIVYPWTHPRFSMVFQENRLLEQETLLDNLRFVAPDLDMESVQNLLEQAGLRNYITYRHNSSKCTTPPVGQLSGGEKRRIAIIRSLLAEYDILLMDEPFTGLDEVSKNQIIALIKNMTKDKTVICVTHNQKEAEALGCNILTLDL